MNWRLARRTAAKPGGIASARHLLRASIASYRQNWRLLAGVAAVVAIPAALLRQISADDITSTYIGLATLVMNLALIWAVMRPESERAISVKEAYYRGTGTLVPFLLVMLMLTLQLLPFMIGTILYALAVLDPAAATTAAEPILLGLIWLVLSFPSVWWLSRYLLAIYPVVDGQTPLAALRQAKARTRGRARAVAARQLLLLLILGLAVLLPTVAISILGAPAWVFLAIQLLSSLVVLPFGYIYLYKLYQALG